MTRVFSFDETPDSRSETASPPAYTLQFRAIGEQDDLAVMNHAISMTPVSVARPTGILYRQNVELEPVGWSNYLVTVPYGKLSRDTGSLGFSFSTTGATVNIKAAKSHVASYPGGVTVDPYKGAIGVKDDGEVDGVEIVIPALRLTYSYRHPAGVVNEAYARFLAANTGFTNSLEWRGFNPGELLYIGADGSDGTDSDAELQHQMVASGNVTDLTIGEITGIAKAGHDAIWIEFKDEVEEGQAVRQPKRVHIDRVYDSMNFAEVLGFS